MAPPAIDAAAATYLAITNQPPHLLQLSLRIAMGLAAAAEQASPSPGSVYYFRSLEHPVCTAYALSMENTVLAMQARALVARLDGQGDEGILKACVSMFRASGQEDEAMTIAVRYPLVTGLARIAVEGESRQRALEYLLDWDQSQQKHWPLLAETTAAISQLAEAENSGAVPPFKPVLNKRKSPTLTIPEAIELRLFALQHGHTPALAALDTFLAQEKYTPIKSLTKDELSARLQAVGLIAADAPAAPAGAAAAAALAWVSGAWTKLRAPRVSAFWDRAAWERDPPSWDDFSARTEGRPTTLSDWNKWLPAATQERKAILKQMRKLYGESLATLPGFPAAPAPAKPSTESSPTTAITAEMLMTDLI